MKKIGLTLVVFGLCILNSCKNQPQEETLNEGEVIQTPSELNETADGLNVAVDTLVSDFDKAGKSIENTIENVQNKEQQLKENINKNAEKANK